MRNKPRIFSKEFKLNVVKLYLQGENGGCKVLSQEFGLNDHKLILRWAQKYRDFGEDGLENMRGKTNSIRRGRPRTVGLTLEDENLKLRAENEYLKKILELNKDNIKKKQHI